MIVRWTADWAERHARAWLSGESESERVLKLLFEHQLQPQYQYRHQWTVGDVLVWDHIGTLHNALPDYEPHEYRLMRRCQVTADRIFDPDYVRANLAVH